MLGRTGWLKYQIGHVCCVQTTWTADIHTCKTLPHTWVCQLWKWPCAPGAGRRRPEGEGAGSERKRGIQSQHVPVGNLTACKALSPAEWDHEQSITWAGTTLKCWHVSKAAVSISTSPLFQSRVGSFWQWWSSQEQGRELPLFLS